jgi:DNA recombination-dependent growth factor C
MSPTMFKNLTPYRLAETTAGALTGPLAFASLPPLLKLHAFEPTHATQELSAGWVQPDKDRR